MISLANTVKKKKAPVKKRILLPKWISHVTEIYPEANLLSLTVTDTDENHSTRMLFISCSVCQRQTLALDWLRLQKHCLLFTDKHFLLG